MASKLMVPIWPPVGCGPNLYELLQTQTHLRIHARLLQTRHPQTQLNSRSLHSCLDEVHGVGKNGGEVNKVYQSFYQKKISLI